MIDTKTCEWLMDNADTPIRYRVVRELFQDGNASKKCEGELFENPAVRLWLKNLKPEIPPRIRFQEHGSFDHLLENALLKSIQLGLHAGLPQVANAVEYYVNKVKQAPGKPCRSICKGIYGFYDSFIHILTCNLLALVEFEDSAIVDNLLESLEELYIFTRTGQYDIYLSVEEKAKLKGIPTIWKGETFIKSSLFVSYGICLPMIYDLVGLSNLYRLKNPEVNKKIDTVISYISTDVFHNTIADGYGIVESSEKKYHSMGWDAKFPGWLDVKGYMENVNAPKLLFYALYISKYPTARETKWFFDLLDYLNKYKTESGRYIFPIEWLREKQGYAVQGNHLSFGENRRKKNWREIESTFYVQLLNQSINNTL